MSASDKWVNENWGDLRDNTNDALKLTAMLPSAADVYHRDGGDMFQEILSQLSTKLYCLNMNVGDHRPGYVPQRPPRHPLNKVDELAAAESSARELWPVSAARSGLKANDAVTVNEMLSEIDQYITGAIEAFAFVPSVLGSIDATDALTLLHERNDVLTTLSKNLREARQELQAMRVQLNEMVEASEKAGAA